MSRFLFVVPPVPGHIGPLVGVDAELRRRGHETAWVGEAVLLEPMVGSDLDLFPASETPIGMVQWLRPDDIRGFAALQFLWEEFLIPLADTMTDGVVSAADIFKPDVMIVDQQALAGAFVADRAGIPWATSVTSPTELADPLAGTPKVQEWLTDLMAASRDRFERGGSATLLPERPEAPPLADPRWSPHLVVAYTTEELTGPLPDLGPEVHLVGPAIADRRTAEPFPFEILQDDVPLVVATAGTVNLGAGKQLLEVFADALSSLDDRVQTIIADPSEVLDRSRITSDRVSVHRWIPQVELLRRASLLVCHAPANSVSEALASGVPMVVAPIRDDQPLIAAKVVEAGAGVRVRAAKVTPEKLVDAITTVLDDPAYAAAAARVRAAFAAAGGAPAAADHFEALAAATAPR